MLAITIPLNKDVPNHTCQPKCFYSYSQISNPGKRMVGFEIFHLTISTVY